MKKNSEDDIVSKSTAEPLSSVSSGTGPRMMRVQSSRINTIRTKVNGVDNT